MTFLKIVKRRNTMDEQLDNQSQQAVAETTQAVQDVTGKAKQVGSKVVDGAKNVGKNVGKAMKKTGEGVAKKVALNPIVLKILLIALAVILVIVLIVAIVVAIVYAVTASDYDPEKGTLSSIYGISGDKFYGARFIYRDDEQASVEIKDDYLKLTYSILNDTKSETGLTITLATDYLSDENVGLITTNYANALLGTSDLLLDRCTLLVDHFGFSDEEITIVFDSIASTLVSKSWTSKSAGEIKSIFDNKYQTDEYLAFKNVTPKIYVWDYILNSEDDSFENLPRKDYYGFIYMPKTNVKMTSASFIFVIDGGYGVDVCLKNKQSATATPVALGEVANANAGWFYDDHMQEFYECEFDVNLSSFGAINTSNVNELSTPTSIYTLKVNNTFSNYFTVTDEITGLTLLENVATSDYIYLEFDNKDESQSPFNFAEQIVEYE